MRHASNRLQRIYATNRQRGAEGEAIRADGFGLSDTFSEMGG